MATENTDSSREATASSDSPTALPMTIYTNSSFFKEHPIPGLRFPAQPNPPPVIIRDLGLFIKYGRLVTIVEASTQIMVREKLQGKVPVPEVFGWVNDGGQGFMYMSLVEGDTLEERWSEIAEDERLYVCKELRVMVDAWRAWKQDESERYIGSHFKQPLNDIILRDYPENSGPFEGPDAVEKFHATCGIEIDNKKEILFTHDDLFPSNIMLTRGPFLRVAAIVDWEQAGCYPEYWEYCKVKRMNQFPEPLHTEWVENYVPMMLKPADEYTIYWAFVAYALARAF
ncbi:hypothetical protein CGCSCA5_v009226 [Colletotrichum siamense]|nr:hypothetical protein CGCSCA5_v009226 [Colletotrichum siamense]